MVSRAAGLRLGTLVAAASLAGAWLPPRTDPDRYLDQFIDSRVSPREDFFHYAVGKWLRQHPIPRTEASWGVGDVVREEVYRRLLGIARDAAAAAAPAGSVEQKVGDFWAAAMDTLDNAREGFAPLDREFARIVAVTDLAALEAEIARLQRLGVAAPYAMYIAQDERHSDRYAVHLWQGGLGLPDRDYYFDSDGRGRRVRRAYTEHVARMFRLLGDSTREARARAATVMAMETELAGSSRKLEALRDPITNYHAMSLDSLDAATPSLRWRGHLADAGVTDVEQVIVGQPEFFEQVDRSLGRWSVEDWKTYLRWHLAHAFAAEAGGRFDAEQFRFYGTILNGTPQQRPRWKRVLDFEEQYLGVALGQIYVKHYFSAATKQRYTRLTGEILDAFRERIRRLDWMSPPTRERALRKLQAVTRKVGYPERWKDYSAYGVERGSFLANAVRGSRWATEYAIAKLRRPVDRTEWEMTPQTYNAYYAWSNNEIVLPAAVFALPGIADSSVDDAIVYGYAGGTTIGHEITHGFDDQGRQFDEHGNLEDWWTPEDAREFQRRAERIVRQFDQYVAVDHLHVNGAATEGENIADLGGMSIAWDAFTRTEQYRRGQEIGGLTPAQRFFLGWALGWMVQIRPEYTAVLVKTDVHAPAPFRVIGPASNMVPFYQAYDVRPGDRMYRADSVRVEIW
jgi:putative endopeptidase